MELTPAQKAAFPKYLDEWLAKGVSTERADRATAERGIDLVYAAAKHKPPKQKIWLDSPLAGAIFDTVIQTLSSPTTPAGKKNTLKPPPEMVERVVDRVLPILADITNHPKLTREFVIGCLDKLVLYNASYGQHDASVLCFYEFFAKECGVDDCKKLEGLYLISKSAGWWWAYDKLAVLTERPTHLNVDTQGRLHSDSDWAVHYPDGFGFCAIHDIQVEPHVVFNPELITIKEIEDQRNVEVRRVMIERYGQARYLFDSGAKLIAKDDWGELYKKPQTNDEDLVMIKVVNSTPEADGSFKDYFLRVPPTMTTPRAAVAWTFEVPETEDYAPRVES